MDANRIIGRMSEEESNWHRQNSIDIYMRDYNSEMESAHQKGIQEKAVEDAVMLVSKYNASPENAAKDMNAPLELVLASLNK